MPPIRVLIDGIMITIQRQAYQSDLKDQEWTKIEPFFPMSPQKGRPQEWPLREIINAILYLLRTGCQWRMLPHDLPPWQTVYYHHRKWRKSRLWEQINQKIREEVREVEGREPTPSAAIVDAQSVKTTLVKGKRGFDGGKKIDGRKRHLIVDTMRLVLMVIVTAASVQDKPGCKLLLARLHQKLALPRLKVIWADKGYNGKPIVKWVQEHFNWLWQVIQRNDDITLVFPNSRLN
jgi:putative transposase